MVTIADAAADRGASWNECERREGKPSSMTTMSPIRGGILHQPTSHEGRYSQSLERGLAILKAFTADRHWMGIAEIAEELEMSRPTAHRYASTLVALDYLEQGPRRKYRLGMRAGDPGRSAVNSTAIRRVPRRYLTELRDKSMCTASVAVLDGGEIVYIERVRSSWRGQSEVASRLGPGSRLPARSTAMGRALLAHVGPERQREAIDAAVEDGQNGQARKAEKEKLEGELRAVGDKGYAIADQVHVKGQTCVAAPLRSREGETIAAVEVAALKSEFSRSQVLERLVPLVMMSAEQISEQLGYTPSK
ncbi:MAG TPA: IclR family transcriptional regulator [Solirubrobacteraceae bacterium]|jgi:IclR family pca regulon transcriptional regulator|nr:IclR family transcriptional regulator [Solirubrobacteraceae bacterium]